MTVCDCHLVAYDPCHKALYVIAANFSENALKGPLHSTLNYCDYPGGYDRGPGTDLRIIMNGKLEAFHTFINAWDDYTSSKITTIIRDNCVK